MLSGESRKTDTTTENRTTKHISKNITKTKRSNLVYDVGPSPSAPRKSMKNITDRCRPPLPQCFRAPEIQDLDANQEKSSHDSAVLGWRHMLTSCHLKIGMVLNGQWNCCFRIASGHPLSDLRTPRPGMRALKLISFGFNDVRSDPCTVHAHENSSGSPKR